MVGVRRWGRMLLMAGLLAVAVAPAALAETVDEATITVVHAVSGEGGFPADIRLAGEITISSMAFEGLAGPTRVPAGAVSLEVFSAGADPAVDAALVADSIQLEPGANYTLVAQMIDDNPAVSLYANDVSSVPAGVGRLTVRQTSGEEVLTFALDGEPTAEALAATAESTTELPAGTYRLTVVSDDGATLADQDLAVAEGAVTVVYAVGSGADGSFGLLGQEIAVDQAPPVGVPTGSGGERATGATAGWLVVPGMFIAVVLVRLALARRRLA
jgi:hypothetical protein